MSESSAMPALEADSPASTASTASTDSIASHHPSTNEMDLELQQQSSAASKDEESSSITSASSSANTDMNGHGNGHDDDVMEASSTDDLNALDDPSSSAHSSPHTHPETESAHDMDESSHSHSSSFPLPSPIASAPHAWVWEHPPPRVVYLTEKLYHQENRKLRGYKLVPLSTLPSAYVLEDAKRKREVKLPKPEPALSTPKLDSLKRRTSTVSASSPDEHEPRPKKEKTKSKASTSTTSTLHDPIQQLQANQSQITELQLKLVQLQQQQVALQMISLGAIAQQPTILQTAGLPLGVGGLNPLLAQSLLGLQNPLLLGAANPAAALASAAAAATPTESKKTLKRKLSTVQTPTLKRNNSVADSPSLSSSSAALPTSIPTPIPVASTTPTASKHGRSIKKHALNAPLDASMLPPSLRKARGVIDNLMKHKLNVSGVFNVPVNHNDPSKPYFASNYLELIAPYSPMDLGTVKSKLSTGEYDTLDELANDVRTIWRNAMQYNSSDSWIHSNADQLGKLFEAEYIKLSQAPATIPAAKPKKAKKDKAAHAPKSARNEEQLREELAELNAKVNQGINEGVPAHELSHLHKRIHQIESELKAAKEPAPKSSSSKKSKTAAPASAPVTKDEKKKLQQDIYTINESNPDVLEGVIDIIRKSVNINSEDEGKEVEIDIDSLPPHTVRELQSYVADAMRKLMEGKGGAEGKENAQSDEYQSSRAQSLIDSDDEATHDTLDDE